MRRSVWLWTLFSAISVTWPVQAEEVGVKSLSGPPEEFATHRLPSASEVAVPSNILLVDRGEGTVDGITVLSFEASQGVGFSLVQVTTQYPHFAPATFTAPDGSQFQFDGAAITCNFGRCGEYQANLLMEAFTHQSPGGSVAFSISGGEVKGGTWKLALQDPKPVFTLSAEPLQVESVLAFEDNYVEVGVEPQPCPKEREESCPAATDSSGRHRDAPFDLTEGAAPVLRLSFANEEMRQQGQSRGIGVTALTVTITETRTRTVFFRKQLDFSRSDGLWVDKSGASLLALPALPVGQYSVRLDIKGNVESMGPIERTAFYALPIIARPYETTGQVRTEVLDGERLEILLEIELKSEGKPHAYAYAEVWSGDGQRPIAWIGGMTQPQGDSSGKLGLPIVLDARWLALAGETGRGLLLRNIAIHDPATFLPIDQIAEVPLEVGELPKAAFLSKEAVVRDDSLYKGKKDRTISVPKGESAPSETAHHEDASGILLVHGWCSSPVWPSGDFGGHPGRVGGTAVFSDPGASRSHDAFAQKIRTQGELHFSEAFTVVAHSQGGAAATHLLAFYDSRLDNSTAPRRVQSMGTPYRGSTLMNYYLASGFLGRLIAEIFDWCAPQDDLGTIGSSIWLSKLPHSARNDVFYYRTGYRRAKTLLEKAQFWRWRCNAASFVIPSWDDGVVSHSQGILPGAHNMGSTEGECHLDMHHGPQTHDSARNNVLDREGRPMTVPYLVGVLRGPAGCGLMEEHDIFFDNEDLPNMNAHGGWIGDSRSSNNTLLRLCGVDGQSFQAAATQGARFAVVALTDTCPAGFTRFDRSHDNEDNDPAAWDTAPTRSPTTTVGTAKDTNMAFCVATGLNPGVANSAFPDLGVPYGVFGGRTQSLSGWALDRGGIHLDDEDNNNRNHPAHPPAFTWEFLQPGKNTTYYMTRVK